MCFQSLHFFVGSEQAVHQDTAYVVVKDDPMAFVGIWIALEDVSEGSGELCYYEGSYLIPPFHCAPGRLHFNHGIDTQATHAGHPEYLHRRSEAGGLPLRRFTPKEGGDAIHSVLCGAGHNLRLILAHLRVLLLALIALIALGRVGGASPRLKFNTAA